MWRRSVTGCVQFHFISNSLNIRSMTASEIDWFNVEMISQFRPRSAHFFFPLLTMGTSKRKKVAPVSCVGCVRRLSPLCRRTVQRQYRGRRQWLALFGIRAKTNKYSLSLSLFHFSASLAIGIYMDRNGSRARRGFTRLAARSISFSNWIWFIKNYFIEVERTVFCQFRVTSSADYSEI